MKRWIKVFIAIIGAVDVMFSIFIPIAIALLLFPLVSGWHQTTLIAFGILSSCYRAIDIGLLKK
jgi:hypothetical protein